MKELSVSRLHKELGRLIEQGHGRKKVHIDKSSFHHRLEDDGVVMLPVCAIQVSRIGVSDGDGFAAVTKRGMERTTEVAVLVGDERRA